MITFCSHIRFLLFSLVTAFAFLMLPATVVADKTTDVSSGVEPGGGCEAAFENLVCEAIFGAPLSGEALIEWEGSDTEGAAFFSGVLEEFGPGTCVIDTDVFPGQAVQISPLAIPDKSTFDALSAPDLRGFCITGIEVSGSGCRGETLAFGEVLSANRLMRVNNTMLTVQVLALPLSCQ